MSPPYATSDRASDIYHKSIGLCPQWEIRLEAYGLLITSMARGQVTLIHEKPKWQTIGWFGMKTRKKMGISLATKI